MLIVINTSWLPMATVSAVVSVSLYGFIGQYDWTTKFCFITLKRHILLDFTFFELSLVKIHQWFCHVGESHKQIQIKKTQNVAFRDSAQTLWWIYRVFQKSGPLKLFGILSLWLNLFAWNLGNSLAIHIHSYLLFWKTLYLYKIWFSKLCQILLPPVHGGSWFCMLLKFTIFCWLGDVACCR